MLVTLSIVLLILTILIALGYPLIANFFGRENSTWKPDSITTLALSLLVGLGISAFATATSYGITGINTYFPILLIVLIINWVILLVTKNPKFVLLRRFRLLDLLIFLPVFLAVYLSSSQWADLTKPVIKVGNGPDVSQNLMAAQNADKIGSTWFSAIDSIKKFLNVDSFDQAAINQFRVPSVRDLASYDYLVFGGRWGLTVPFNQLSKIFGPQLILWETSIVLLFTLLSLVLIFFALGKLHSNSYLLPTLLSASLVSNPTFIYQFINGGLSQVVGTISLSGLLFSYLLIIKKMEIELSKREQIGISVVALASWLGSLVTYIDSLFVITTALLISTIIIFFINRSELKKLILFFYSPGLLALALAPIFTYSNILSFRLRIRAASGTGYFSERWNIPSEQFGFINSFSSVKMSPVSRVTSIIIFLVILAVLITTFYKSKLGRNMSSIAIGCLIVIGVGYYASISSNQKSSYIYEKVSLYLAPLVVTALYIVVINLKSTNKSNSGHLLFIGLASISIFSGVHFQETYYKNFQTTVIPYGLGDLLKDESLQNELAENNYLIPYKAEYNYMGLLGAANWISKAPNDFILKNRLNNELRLICFALDTSCKPTTARITNPRLEFYGIYEYVSPLSTEQFSKLSIDDRFNTNFDVFGLPREIVPEKFKGGNPYFQ